MSDPLSRRDVLKVAAATGLAASLPGPAPAAPPAGWVSGMMMGGQALVEVSCGASRFCHTQGIDDVDRFGAPVGLDLDVAIAVEPAEVDGRLRHARRVAWNLRHTIVEQVEAGAMPPPPPSGDTALGAGAHYRTPDGRALPSIRSQEGMDEGVRKVKALRERVNAIGLADKSKVFNTARVEALEVENLIEAAQATMEGAAARRECRGAHLVRDYEHPADHAEHPLGRNDKEWMKHTLWYSEGNRLAYKPVKMQPLTVESVPPKVRTF